MNFEKKFIDFYLFIFVGKFIYGGFNICFGGIDLGVANIFMDEIKFLIYGVYILVG